MSCFTILFLISSSLLVTFSLSLSSCLESQTLSTTTSVLSLKHLHPYNRLVLLYLIHTLSSANGRTYQPCRPDHDPESRPRRWVIAIYSLGSYDARFDLWKPLWMFTWWMMDDLDYQTIGRDPDDPRWCTPRLDWEMNCLPT
jgi:hypothetical protein